MKRQYPTTTVKILLSAQKLCIENRFNKLRQNKLFGNHLFVPENCFRLYLKITFSMEDCASADEMLMGDYGFCSEYGYLLGLSSRLQNSIYFSILQCFVHCFEFNDLLNSMSFVLQHLSSLYIREKISNTSNKDIF